MIDIVKTTIVQISLPWNVVNVARCPIAVSSVKNNTGQNTKTIA